MTTTEVIELRISFQSQNLLTRSEAERRQLEEKVADLQSTVSELKRQKDQLSESKNKAQQDLSNAEIRNAELEMAMKSLKGVSLHNSKRKKLYFLSTFECNMHETINLSFPPSEPW